MSDELDRQAGDSVPAPREGAPARLDRVAGSVGFYAPEIAVAAGGATGGVVVHPVVAVVVGAAMAARVGLARLVARRDRRRSEGETASSVGDGDAAGGDVDESA